MRQGSRGRTAAGHEGGGRGRAREAEREIQEAEGGPQQDEKAERGADREKQSERQTNSRSENWYSEGRREAGRSQGFWYVYKERMGVGVGGRDDGSG